MSPTARTLAYVRQQGGLAQVVERWNQYARRRVDLWGFIDVLVLDDSPGVLGIQATTTGNVSHRLAKLREECGPAMAKWLAAGNRLAVFGWSLKGARGKRKTWTLTERVVTPADLTGPPPGSDPTAA